MDSRQIRESESWQQKESVHTGLKERAYDPTPEVYSEQPGLQPIFENHRAGHANNTPGIGHQQPRKSGSTKHQRLWLLSAIAAVLVCSAIGLGVGLHFRGNSTNSTSTDTTSQQSATVTTVTVSMTSSSSTSTTTSTTSATAPVTSGRTGITASDCKTKNSYITNNNPTTFVFDCGADYYNTQTAHSGNGAVVDLAHLITYTFENCMETCTFYNTLNSTTVPCRAISYSANLTAAIGSAIESDSANCWLKNVRGQQYYGNAIRTLSDSAYIDTGE